MFRNRPSDTCTILDLVEAVERFKTNLPLRMVVAPDIAERLDRVVSYTAHPVGLFGIRYTVNANLPAGAWVENFRNRDVVHLPNGRTVEIPSTYNVSLFKEAIWPVEGIDVKA